MTLSEIEKYKYQTVELTYFQWINAPGIVVENGNKIDKIVKRKAINKRVGVIGNTTAKKVVFLIDDDGDDLEIYIPYEHITKIERV